MDRPEGRRVSRDSIILEVSSQHAAQPLAHLTDGLMHPAVQFRLDALQFRGHPFPDGFAQHTESFLASLAADVGESQEIKRLRFSESALLPVLRREAAKFQEPRFLVVQFQIE